VDLRSIRQAKTPRSRRRLRSTRAFRFPRRRAATPDRFTAGAVESIDRLPAVRPCRSDVCQQTSTMRGRQAGRPWQTVLIVADGAGAAAAHKAEAALAAAYSQAAVRSRAAGAGRGHRARWGNSAGPRDRDAIPAGRDKARTRSRRASQETQAAKRSDSLCGHSCGDPPSGPDARVAFHGPAETGLAIGTNHSSSFSRGKRHGGDADDNAVN
jgi:hypothetical protein